MAYLQQGRHQIDEFLGDISARKEFRALVDRGSKGTSLAGFRPASDKCGLFLPGLRLTGAQTFIRNFQNPDTNYKRLLIKWQTGVGKSIAAISISREFIKQYRVRASLGERTPRIIIISFTHKETIQEDMLRYPEFGFVSQYEVEEIKKMKDAALKGGAASTEARQYSSIMGVYRRRITDHTRGGFYQFYGYKEFANHLFMITPRGVQEKFDVQNIYNRGEGEFSEKLMDAVKRGHLKINEDLLNELRGGLIVADEIHNVYNIMEPNNYGIAIQYVLDALSDEAPHAVFMSATPITGAASEIIDLLNLLVPRSELPDKVPLRRTDFFARTSDGSSDFVISQLRPGALDKIANLAAGRVSFLLDSDTGSYPRRLFIGESVANVPYIKLTECPMSDFHERTLLREYADKNITDRHPNSGLPANTYTLYNMAFPNPESEEHGLYKSIETPEALRKAPAEWKSNTGVIVEQDASLSIITGAFLSREHLPKYSTKYMKILESTIGAVRGGPGKIMIYHHKVRMSGVILLQEVLRMNGFIDETSPPTDSTLCSVCGSTLAQHGATHTYQPARFIVAHSDIDRPAMMRSIAAFNAISNLNGHNIRVIIGSKIIREGFNFKAIRHQFIASLPTDYPTMIQVFGRVVRKDSHSDLPPDERTVQISVFVSTYRGGSVSPELQKYIDKGKEYLIIQEVERVLHVYAVDGFANYEKIQTALGSESTIDALPYKPRVQPASRFTYSTFLAYGHGEKEVALLLAVCRALFKVRPVWTYSDLRNSIASVQTSYDTSMIDEGNFALALQKLAQPFGDPPTEVVKAGKYYICIDSMPNSTLDVGCYLGLSQRRHNVSVKISEYTNNELLGQNWAMRIREFEKKYLAKSAKSPVELSLIEYNSNFHYKLIRQLILSDSGDHAQITSDDAKIRDLYSRFRITISDKGKIVGYVTEDSIALYDGHWYNVNHSEYGIGQRHKENSVLVGFVVNEDETPTNVYSKFKIRPPIQKIKSGIDSTKKGDMRGLARGAVCETRTREELSEYIINLKRVIKHGGGEPDLDNAIRKALVGAYSDTHEAALIDLKSIIRTSLPADISYAARLDQTMDKRYPSTAEMCTTIRVHLLALEEKARSCANGMLDSTRWLYLFNDRLPTISAIIEK